MCLSSLHRQFEIEPAFLEYFAFAGWVVIIVITTNQSKGLLNLIMIYMVVTMPIVYVSVYMYSNWWNSFRVEWLPCCCPIISDVYTNKKLLTVNSL